MVGEMASMAAECFKRTRRASVWSVRLGKYVCSDTLEGQEALDQLTWREAAKHPPLSSEFKVVFATAVAGTAIFACVCVTLTFLAGKEPHPLLEKVIMGLFDLVKIGFGAVVGLLGGKQIASEGR
jgi:hypothetical protein